MKNAILQETRKAFVLMAAGVAVFATLASHFEWEGKTGQISIGKSATWTMDDEDVAYINANISRITVSGMLVLDNLSTWPLGTGGKRRHFSGVLRERSSKRAKAS